MCVCVCVCLHVLFGVPKCLRLSRWLGCDEYEGFINQFLAFNEVQPGTHPVDVAKVVLHAVTTGDFKLRCVCLSL